MRMLEFLEIGKKEPEKFKDWKWLNISVDDIDRLVKIMIENDLIRIESGHDVYEANANNYLLNGSVVEISEKADFFLFDKDFKQPPNMFPWKNKNDWFEIEKILRNVKTELKIEDFDIKDFFEDEKHLTGLISQRVAQCILKHYNFRTIMGSDEIYFYEDGKYKNEGKVKVRELCNMMLGDKNCNHYVSEVIGRIMELTYVEANSINNSWINLENGLLNVRTWEFREHTPDIFTTGRVGIVYDKTADCPLWKSKLVEKVDERTIDVLQEYFGYCFQSGEKYQKALLLFGRKRTMKSTVLAMLAFLLGRENVTGMPLQQITEDPFAVAYLFGKSANVCADLTKAQLNDVGKFMTIVGGDIITAGKKHDHLFSFIPSTKLIFSCNEIPTTVNKNPAFYRRWIILEFDRTTEPADIDTELLKKFEAEGSGILNWAIEGLKRLENNKKFSYWLTDEQIKELYERNSDTISAFINSEITTENDLGTILIREAYTAYLEYCKKNNLQPENIIRFGRYFKAITGCGTSRVNKIPAYQGVNFKGKPENTGLVKFQEENHYSSDSDDEEIQ